MPQPFQTTPTVLINIITQILDDCDAISFIRTCSETFHRMKSVYHLRSLFTLKFIHDDLFEDREEDRATTLTIPFGGAWKRPTHFIGLICDLIISRPHESGFELGREPSEANRLKELMAQPWHKDLIPASVRRLEFDHKWKRHGPRLIDFNLPEYLVHFVTHQVDQSIVESLSLGGLERLTSLHLPLFELPLDLTQMSRLRTLELSCWNLPIEHLHLPDSLEELVMGNAFAQSIDEWILPPQLQFLQLNGTQNAFKWKKDQLPTTLTHLNYFKDVLGPKFPNVGSANPFSSLDSVEGMINSTLLPEHLIHLSLPCLFEAPLSDVVLPAGLLELDLHWEFDQDRLQQLGRGAERFADLKLPAQLQRLRLHLGTAFSLKDVQLPPSLIEFDYSDMASKSTLPPLLFKSSPQLRVINFSQNIDYNPKLDEIEYWPNSLRVLRLGPAFSHPIHDLVLPDELEEFVIVGPKFQSSLPELLPTNLRILHVTTFRQERHLDQLSHDRLPKLHTLILGNGSSKTSLPERLSATLRLFELNRHSCMNPMTQSLATILPTQLTSLSLCGSFNAPLVGNILPSSLVRLTLGQDFDSPIEDLILPESMKRLTFSLDSPFNQPIGRLLLPIHLISLTLPPRYCQVIHSLTRHPLSLHGKKKEIIRFSYGQPIPTPLYVPPLLLTQHPIKIFF